MKKAIIAGATGLIGTAVANYLSLQGVKVLCLGRKMVAATAIEATFGHGADYLRLLMEDILTLKENVESLKWTPEDDCVFYNFAWSGENKLTDGSFEQQLKNAVEAANAVQAAKSVGCSKFISAGTMEETYAEEWMNNERKDAYISAQTNYALAKLAARDMCKILAYLHKIDYVHTRLSVPLDYKLTKGSYIATTLKKIVAGQSYEEPADTRLFDIISTDDVARAYYLIGNYGKNKANYYIGTSKPGTLAQYFQYVKDLIGGVECSDWGLMAVEKASLFDISQLHTDTGFVAENKFQDLLTSDSRK